MGIFIEADISFIGNADKSFSFLETVLHGEFVDSWSIILDLTREVMCNTSIGGIVYLPPRETYSKGGKLYVYLPMIVANPPFWYLAKVNRLVAEFCERNHPAQVVITLTSAEGSKAAAYNDCAKYLDVGHHIRVDVKLTGR